MLNSRPMESAPPQTPPADQYQVAVLPAGAAIHAGFWRRLTAGTLDALTVVSG
ncbi:MAG: hypothetical protein LBI48_02650 [Burkholderiaceae bacterium]|nr:hypothetical protein [Burkholderiaceae bacterium]